MAGEMREKDQADFDQDRFIEMFDEALTSQDPRVMKTLRDLMMIVTLTRPESRNSGFDDRNMGPLRRLAEDVRQAHRRIGNLEEMIKMVMRERTEALHASWPREVNAEEKYKLAAAAPVAQSIDDDVMKNIARQLNSGGAELNLVPPKGKLTK